MATRAAPCEQVFTASGAMADAGAGGSEVHAPAKEARACNEHGPAGVCCGTFCWLRKGSSRGPRGVNGDVIWGASSETANGHLEFASGSSVHWPRHSRVESREVVGGLVLSLVRIRCDASASLCCCGGGTVSES